MDNYSKKTGHLLAILTILLWGTTFVSTKILLIDFAPIEILFFRFILGFIALFIACPRILKINNLKIEIMFIFAGLCGVTLYFLLENIALTYTFASNVGVIVAIAPFTTAIFASLFLKEEKLEYKFFIGFLVSITGIIIVTFSGESSLHINPLGDILAVLAVLVWSAYSILMKKIGNLGYNTIQVTRRVFFYGLILMIPALFIFDFNLDLFRFTRLPNLLNILYLGVGASAICFVTWNISVERLGAIKASAYLYMSPVITIVSSAIVLGEKITTLTVLGAALTLVGLYISEKRSNKKRL